MATPAKGDRRQRFREEPPKPEPKKTAKKAVKPTRKK